MIVSVGGGSLIDAAKIMISLLQQETGGDFVKQIAIPTTLSAAEYAVSRSTFNAQLLIDLKLTPKLVRRWIQERQGRESRDQ